MANPIKPSGKKRGSCDSDSFEGYDIADKARKQDIERRIREDNEHFERTGENRLPYTEYDPLVPINGYTPPDVADDGDSYDESYEPNNHTSEGEYVEDKPTKFIDKSSKEEKKAYIEREKVKQEKEFTQKRDKRKKKFKNAITGLGLDEK